MWKGFHHPRSWGLRITMVAPSLEAAAKWHPQKNPAAKV